MKPAHLFGASRRLGFSSMVARARERGGCRQGERDHEERGEVDGCYAEKEAFEHPRRRQGTHDPRPQPGQDQAEGASDHQAEDGSSARGIPNTAIPGW